LTVNVKIYYINTPTKILLVNSVRSCF